MKDENINNLLNQALSLHHEQNLEKADEIYQLVLTKDPDNFLANHLHGCILSQHHNYRDALIYLKKAVEIDPSNYEANNNLGITYKNLKDFKNSEIFFKQAITIDSFQYKAFFNCANLYIDNDQYSDAIDFLKKTISCNKDFPEADHRIGEVYQYIFQTNRDLTNINNSIEWFNSAIRKDANFADSHLMLGMSYLWLGDLKNADKKFKEVLSLNYSNEILYENNIKNSLGDERLLSTLVKHEYEQLTYIDNDIDAIRNPKFTQEYYNSLKNLYEKSINNNIKLSDVTSDMKKSLFKVLYNKPPKISSSSLINKDNDINTIEDRYISGNPEIIVIDNFLDKSALKEIQNFCRNANVFKYPYHGGYVGAFLSKGLSNEFILKLNDDLRLTYKKIFKDLRLTQAWIFKYDSARTGTNIHADQASVNVNFWITPEQGNLNKNSGGLKVWNSLPPDDWDFSEYNSLQKSPKIKEMLDSKGICNMVIPYKENRAVIFNSKLFHATDDFEFDNSYENRRVNITFLYD